MMINLYCGLLPRESVQPSCVVTRIVLELSWFCFVCPCSINTSIWQALLVSISHSPELPRVDGSFLWRAGMMWKGGGCLCLVSLLFCSPGQEQLHWVKDKAVPEITPRFDPSDPVVIPSLDGFRAKVLTLSCYDWVTLAIILFNRPFKAGSDNLKWHFGRGLLPRGTVHWPGQRSWAVPRVNSVLARVQDKQLLL